MTMLDMHAWPERRIMLDESHFELSAGVNKKKKKLSELFDERSLHSERATLICHFLSWCYLVVERMLLWYLSSISKR
jgi:hypothetical protein